jgi:uncharacterized damage-inducible protein DinB
MRIFRILSAGVLLSSMCAFGQQPEKKDKPEPKGVHADLLKNLDDTQKKIVSLAEAIPADKYTWRPGEGVRSISEVFMHIAGANYMIPSALGAAPPAGITPDMEKKVTDKAEVMKRLTDSFAHLQKAMESAPDLEKKATLFGRDNTTGGVEVLIVTHLHEHLGQAIAYARMNKVSPPWSAGRN